MGAGAKHARPSDDGTGSAYPIRSMNDFWKICIGAGATVVGGLFVTWVNHRRTVQHAANSTIEKEKDDFGKLILKQMADLPERKIQEFYESTKPVLKEAVF